jgi:hypothetical protein
MGDRANIYLLDTEDGSAGMFVYTHWKGDSWPRELQQALDLGEARWGDPQYLARFIVTHVFKDLDGLTGGGLSTQIGDNEYPILCVDLLNDKVGLCDPHIDPGNRDNWTCVMSFAHYVAIDDVDWEDFATHQIEA